MPPEKRVTIYYNPKTQKIARTEPRGLRELIKQIPGTSIVCIPDQFFDLSNRLYKLCVQLEYTDE